VLFCDYKYRAVRTGDELLDIYDWATRSRNEGSYYAPAKKSPPSSRRESRDHKRRISEGSVRQITDGRHRSSTGGSVKSLSISTDASMVESPPISEVLVIEAFGVSDNEVLARAWCSFEGVHAIVANVRETCMACAIREAIAACVSVVILTAGGSPEENDSSVCL
jgi:hypothetical protein